jgi:hypothetical protein
MSNYITNPYLYWHNKMMHNYTIYENSKNKKTTRQINVSGEWDTNWGKMTLEQNDNKVTGTYEWDNGKLEGNLEEYTLKGFWSEPQSYDCPNEKGTFELTFYSDGKSFIGSWGYCDVKIAGDWTGTLKTTTPQLNVSGVWIVGDGKIILEQHNGNVKGKYLDLDLGVEGEGDIFGILQGNILIGQWYGDPALNCPGGSGGLKILFSPQGNSLLIHFSDYTGLVNTFKAFKMNY